MILLVNGIEPLGQERGNVFWNTCNLVMKPDYFQGLLLSWYLIQQRKKSLSKTEVWKSILATISSAKIMAFTSLALNELAELKLFLSLKFAVDRSLIVLLYNNFIFVCLFCFLIDRPTCWEGKFSWLYLQEKGNVSRSGILPHVSF